MGLDTSLLAKTLKAAGLGIFSEFMMCIFMFSSNICTVAGTCSSVAFYYLTVKALLRVDNGLLHSTNFPALRVAALILQAYRPHTYHVGRVCERATSVALWETFP
jgi:hypothetical protein